MSWPISPLARRTPRTTFLVWHDIVPSSKLVWFDTTIREFEAQLIRLEKAGARPQRLDTIQRWLMTGAGVPPERSVVLCFDDNTEGIFRYAFPILKKRGWPFVVSAHTAYVGVRTSKGHNTWQQLKVMEQGGGTIVNQTHTHPPDLRMLKEPMLLNEIVKARHLMATMLSHDVRYLTYPSGKWDTRVAQAAQKAGCLLALTEDYGRAETSPHLLGIRRYSTHKRFEEAVQQLKR
ncbi:MAG: polysaccharide deacetylase family protein [Armatimonas sp.]